MWNWIAESSSWMYSYHVSQCNSTDSEHWLWSTHQFSEDVWVRMVIEARDMLFLALRAIIIRVMSRWCTWQCNLSDVLWIHKVQGHRKICLACFMSFLVHLTLLCQAHNLTWETTEWSSMSWKGCRPTSGHELFKTVSPNFLGWTPEVHEKDSWDFTFPARDSKIILPQPRNFFLFYKFSRSPCWYCFLLDDKNVRDELVSYCMTFTPRFLKKLSFRLSSRSSEEHLSISLCHVFPRN